MLILLSCAKTMCDAVKTPLPFASEARFASEASAIALQMSQYPVEELERLLRVNASIAVENYRRYQRFHADDARSLQALAAYTGIVFKRLNPADFTDDDFRYAQEHLRLTSFCYGLLRPMDRIRPYRLEGNVVLPEGDGLTLFDYWKPKLTDLLVKEIKEAGGTLLYLASDEMRGLFDWKRVEKEVRVVTPDFKVWKGGKLKTVVIYTKMARGEMAREAIKNKVENVDDMKHFSWEGFEYDGKRSAENNWLFTQLI